jgi:hypothetical protein
MTVMEDGEDTERRVHSLPQEPNMEVYVTSYSCRKLFAILLGDGDDWFSCSVLVYQENMRRRVLMPLSSQHCVLILDVSA